MKTYLVLSGFLLVVIGTFSLWSSFLVWTGYSVYQMVKTDIGFFSIVLPNIGFFVGQLVLSLITLFVGSVLVNSK